MNNITLATYIWIDAEGSTRSKSRILKLKKVRELEELPIWNFDGSSTRQAEGKFSDVFLHPKRIYADPWKGASHILVLCDCWDDDKTPNAFNTRRSLEMMMEKHSALEPLCGIEQEYILFDRKTNLPFGWKGFNEPGCGPQGPYYCSNGGNVNFGRAVSEKHMELCLKAGIELFGTNAEVMPAQWEFQVGTADPLKVADDLWVARFILNRITEDFDAFVSLHPKPYLGDWNGSGAHTNFSTRATREEGGIKKIEQICGILALRHHEYINHYGKNNNLRLTGHHETQSMEKFTWGVGDRGASIRIPKQVQVEGKGYFEDRRPASNMDPYLVLNLILSAVAGE